MPSDRHTLTHLLDGLERAAEERRVSLRDILGEFGDRSITPLILLIALMLVTPLSGIPGMPTASAVLIVLLAIQALSGRRQLWLPRFLLDRRITGKRLNKGVQWLRRPCAFIDRHSQPRLRWLTAGPMRSVALLACAVIPIGWPPLEMLPFVSSIGAGTVALLAFGLFTRDGIYLLFGYGAILITLLAGYAVFV